MSARALTWFAVVVLGAVALGLAAVLMLQRGSGDTAATMPDAGACPDPVAPRPLSPPTVDTVLLAFTEGPAALKLDGKPLISLPEEPLAFAVGEHSLSVECDRDHKERVIALAPFKPAAVYASCADVYVFGTSCDGCAAEDASRKAAAKAGKNSVLYLASTSQQHLDTAERSRAASMLTARWNTLTERYARVLGVVGRGAAGPVAKANLRFEELSAGFNRATTERDPAAQDELIRAAEETLAAFVKAARNAMPQDCDLQKRLTDSFEKP